MILPDRFSLSRENFGTCASRNPLEVLSAGFFVLGKLRYAAVRSERQHGDAGHSRFKVERDHLFADHFAHVQDVNPLLAIIRHCLFFRMAVKREGFGLRHADMRRGFRFWIGDITNTSAARSCRWLLISAAANEQRDC